MSNKVREHMTFEGRVQEVGFRYKMRQLAGRYGVTGWVRNEYDGSVSAELQGLPEELDLILQEIRQDRYIRIDRIVRKKIALEEAEAGFRERY